MVSEFVTRTSGAENHQPIANGRMNGTDSSPTIPYEKAAMRRGEMPGGLSYPDQLLFLALRSLYAQLKAGVIDRPVGVVEKKKLLESYRVQKFNWEMGDHFTRLIKNTELARAAYRKERTLENADKLLAALDGVT